MDNNNINVRGIVRPQVSLKGEIQKGIGTGVSIITKTKEEWALLPHMMSKKNVIYVYSNYRVEIDPVTQQEKLIPRVKLGDGTTYVADLPFTTMSITDEDIARWNDHVGVYVDEENNNMIFYH